MSKRLKYKLKLQPPKQTLTALTAVEKEYSIYKEVDPLIRDLTQICIITGLRDKNFGRSIQLALEIFNLELNRSIYPLIVACDFLSCAGLEKHAIHFIDTNLNKYEWLTDDQKSALKLKKAIYLEFSNGSREEIEKLKNEVKKNLTISSKFDFSQWNIIEKAAEVKQEAMESPL